MKIHSTEMIIWYSGIPDKDGNYIVKIKKEFQNLNLLGNLNEFGTCRFAEGYWNSYTGFISSDAIEAFTQSIL